MTIPIFDDIALARRTVLRRVPLDEVEITPAMLDANERIYGARLTPAEAVDRIILDVRGRGDAALSDWSARLDGVRRSAFEVPRARFRRAVGALAPELVEALKLAAGEIERFHRRQARNSWVDFNVEGALGQIVLPLQRVGLYAPGGSAPLPSSLLMAAIPARVAGVEEIVVCSPPQRDTGEVAEIVLAAAHLAGVDRVFALGGAQAIAAMAYGTQTVPQVDKIAGPGNLYVVLAKRAVYGVVGIEALPGPTETIVIAPELADAFALANAYAPEHLCLLLKEPWQHIGRVRNAGGIFLGERSFEVLGDYVAGPSHIMPTGGTARYASPVNVDDFRKVISLVGLNEAALRRIGPAAARLADAEGLTGHAAAVRARLDE